jgi:hypothetical protein
VFMVDFVSVAFAKEVVLAQGGLEGRLRFRAGIIAVRHRIVSSSFITR